MVEPTHQYQPASAEYDYYGWCKRQDSDPYKRLGCIRMSLPVLARHSRHLTRGIEWIEDTHESATAIRCDYWHNVHILAKKLRGCRYNRVGLPHTIWRLPHEITNGRLKGQTSAQRAEKLPEAAIALQDFTFGDQEGRVSVLKPFQGLG